MLITWGAMAVAVALAAPRPFPAAGANDVNEKEAAANDGLALRCAKSGTAGVDG